MAVTAKLYVLATKFPGKELWYPRKVGSTTSMDVLEEGKKSHAPTEIWTTDRPARNLVTILTELPWLPMQSVILKLF